MIDGSEERKRQLAFELQNLCVFEKRSKRLGGRLHEKQKAGSARVTLPPGLTFLHINTMPRTAGSTR